MNSQMASHPAVVPLRSRRRYPDGDLAVRLRVSHLVESVDFEPHELPPAATLIVRRFADPMPGCLSSDPSALVPAPAWERAARSGLADLAQRAVRPARDPVPSDANAVLFIDQAELLACFSRDLLRGAASSLWWWRALLRSLPSSASLSLLEAWRRDIRYVPSALAHLAARREVEWVLNSFSSAQALTILEEVTRVFGIDPLRVVLQSPSWSLSQPGPAHSGAEPAYAEDLVSAMTSLDRLPWIAPPWYDVLAEDLVPSRLSRERIALLGVSLMLSHAPGIARSRGFTEAFSRWYRSPRVEPGRRIETRPSAESDVKVSSSDLAVIHPTERRSMNGIDVPHHSHTCAEDGRTDARTSGKDTEEHAPAFGSGVEPLLGDAKSAHGAFNRRSDEAAAEMQTREEASERKGHQPGLNSDIEAIARSDEASQGVLAAAIGEPPSSKGEALEASTPISRVLCQIGAGEGEVTELGGILFLVNVLKALRLPDSLEEACGCPLGLGSWELVELIARCLLGPGHARLASDPLWIMLASLDGRSPEQKAGKHFAPSSCYRIPAEWIPVSESGHLASDLAIRLRGRLFEVWHRFGFPCVIRQFEQPPSRSQIEREMYETFALETCSFLRHYPRLWATGRLLDFAPKRPLRRFLSFLLPFIRWRLAAAVGQQAAQKPIRAEAILLRTGRIWVTSTHVDLVMDMRQATGPVRLAGLDVDPGWVPELGRVIKFHFQ